MNDLNCAECNKPVAEGDIIYVDMSGAISCVCNFPLSIIKRVTERAQAGLIKHSAEFKLFQITDKGKQYLKDNEERK